MRRRAKPAKGKAEAERPLVRKSPKNEAVRVRDLEKRLAEALKGEAEALKREAEAQAQQAATAEILRVISSSTTDIQPVFDAIVESAVRLCDGLFSALYKFDGELIHLVAHHNYTPALEEMHRIFPARPARALLPGRAILERAVVHIPDVLELDPEFRVQVVARTLGFRSGLWVPMLREGAPLGVISVTRREPGGFNDDEIALLRTFADQAVIAIENVRLFKELEQRNRDLTATGEILQVIASSPTDAQPVFDTIVRSAVLLSGAMYGSVVRFDGELMHLAAGYNYTPEVAQALHEAFPMRPSPLMMSGRAILSRDVVQVEDALEDRDYAQGVARAGGFRSMLAAPMLRDGRPIGAIVVNRGQPGRFAPTQIALLQTFADQAVIAIENVRLFTELRASNRDLTEALDQQTATSEVLKVISQSQTDVQPVFEAIIQSAVRLCDAVRGTVYRFDGELMHMAAQAGYSEEQKALFLSFFPRPPGIEAPPGRAILERAIVHIQSHEVAGPSLAVMQQLQAGSTLAVPLLRDGSPIGAIGLSRIETRAYSDAEISLIQTFADQAVIAIENVRLFKELEARNRDLTATSQILQVISSSPTDAQPVFESIVRSTLRLCDAKFCVAYRYDGEQLHVVAHDNLTPEMLALLKARYPQPPSRETATGVSTLERRVVHIPDAAAADLPLASREFAHQQGWGSMLAVPLLRGGQPVGNIAVSRVERKPFTDQQIALVQAFADQAVIAIENARLFTELQASNRELTTALNTQTATSDILRVISRSQTNVQPVFDAIMASAVRLLRGYTGALTRVAGDQVELAAHMSFSEAAAVALRELFPRSLQSEGPAAQTVRDRAPVNIADQQTDPQVPEPVRAMARASGHRSVVWVPLLHDDEAVGGIGVTRREPGGFTEDEIALLQTFADQAVIAIENVRLFNETKEALDRQTATAEILRVISSSPTDLQPVMDAVAENAARVCGATDAYIRRIEGDTLRLVARFGSLPLGLPDVYPINREYPAGRAVVERRTIHIDDILPLIETEYPRLAGTTRRTFLTTPLMREGVPIGVILIRRTTVQPFTDKQIALLQTFADQAVIAIENVRLFTELQEKNLALTRAHAQVTEALDQQTATSEILRVISSSPTDVQPVFDTIVASATRLCNGLFSAVYRYDGELIHLVAHHNFSPTALAAARRTFPMPPSRGGATARAVLTREVVHIPDLRLDPEYAHPVLARDVGFPSLLAVPMLRDGKPIGAIVVAGVEAAPFSDKQITLLKTFAEQAVIAIENVRLFAELQASNRELTTALDTQTATADILRVISRSPTDVQPVFDAIVQSAVRLLRGYSSTLARIAGDQIELAALTSTEPAADAALRARYPQPLDSDEGYGLAILNRAPLNIADALTDPRLPEAQRTSARVRGFRSLVVVPLLRHDEAIGALGVSRRAPGGFTDDEMALLQTFADQAVIAIENARLLSELHARTQELTRSVEQLTALGDVGRAVSSSLDLDTVLTTIVGRAVQLSGTDGGTIFEYDEATEEFAPRATLNADEGQAAMLRATRLRRGEGAVGQMAVTREPIQIPDIAAEGAYESRLRGALLEAGTRAVLAIPLLHEERLVGGLVVTRRRSGAFTAEVVEILKTFATQSALAIQNARLFREIEEKSRQLEVASQHKSEFLANMSHELRTPLNAIIGFSEVLGERMFGEMNEKQEEYLKDIHASGQHLLSLINDILDLSKIEAGRMELELTDFNLPATLDNALTLVRERAGRRGIALGLTVDERLEQIHADERKVRQVVLNLLSNAIKFTPEGGRIEVRAVPVDGMVEISVSDTGVGIAPEDQEAIFEEFKQVGTAAKKVEGTGLGLALSRKFVELHGGKIWVQSQVGVGSTFTFTIPMRT